MYLRNGGFSWMTASICKGTGLCSMLIAHLISAKLAFASDRRLNATDVLLSWLSVWQPTLDRLPRTCKRVWAMVWGMAAVLTAVTIIGGIDYGAPFRTHKAPDISPMNVVGTVAAAAASQAKAQGKKDASLAEAMGELQSQVAQAAVPGGGNPNMSMEESLNELGDMEGQIQGMSAALDAAADVALNGGLTDEEAEKASTSTLDCFIYGVVTDSKNIPTGFLFAANTRGVDQHVAEISAADLPRTSFRKIAVRLYKEIQKTPEVESDRSAIWVKPVVFCRIRFKGYLENGELSEAEFETMLVNQRGVLTPDLKGTRPSPATSVRR